MIVRHNINPICTSKSSIKYVLLQLSSSCVSSRWFSLSLRCALDELANEKNMLDAHPIHWPGHVHLLGSAVILRHKLG